MFMADEKQDQPIDIFAVIVEFFSTLIISFLNIFIKVFPIISIGFIVVLILLYLFFKLLGFA
jgi:hypothetical protein